MAPLGIGQVGNCTNCLCESLINGSVASVAKQPEGNGYILFFENNKPRFVLFSSTLSCDIEIPVLFKDTDIENYKTIAPIYPGDSIESSLISYTGRIAIMINRGLSSAGSIEINILDVISEKLIHVHKISSFNVINSMVMVDDNVFYADNNSTIDGFVTIYKNGTQHSIIPNTNKISITKIDNIPFMPIDSNDYRFELVTFINYYDFSDLRIYFHASRPEYTLFPSRLCTKIGYDPTELLYNSDGILYQWIRKSGNVERRIMSLFDISNNIPGITKSTAINPTVVSVEFGSKLIYSHKTSIVIGSYVGEFEIIGIGIETIRVADVTFYIDAISGDNYYEIINVNKNAGENTGFLYDEESGSWVTSILLNYSTRAAPPFICGKIFAISKSNGSISEVTGTSGFLSNSLFPDLFTPASNVISGNNRTARGYTKAKGSIRDNYYYRISGSLVRYGTVSVGSISIFKSTTYISNGIYNTEDLSTLYSESYYGESASDAISWWNDHFDSVTDIFNNINTNEPDLIVSGNEFPETNPVIIGDPWTPEENDNGGECRSNSMKNYITGFIDRTKQWPWHNYPNRNSYAIHAAPKSPDSGIIISEESYDCGNTSTKWDGCYRNSGTYNNENGVEESMKSFTSSRVDNSDPCRGCGPPARNRGDDYTRRHA